MPRMVNGAIVRARRQVESTVYSPRSRSGIADTTGGDARSIPPALPNGLSRKFTISDNPVHDADATDLRIPTGAPTASRAEIVVSDADPSLALRGPGGTLSEVANGRARGSALGWSPQPALS